MQNFVIVILEWKLFLKKYFRMRVKINSARVVKVYIIFISMSPLIDTVVI